MIAINGIIITDKMHEAGSFISGNLINASIRNNMTGLGGCKSFNLKDFRENQDLIQKYIDNEIDAIQAVYLAMERKRDVD